MITNADVVKCVDFGASAEDGVAFDFIMLGPHPWPPPLCKYGLIIIAHPPIFFSVDSEYTNVNFNIYQNPRYEYMGGRNTDGRHPRGNKRTL